MANTNYFSTDDPLNLKYGSTLTNPKLKDPIYKFKYNSDVNFRELELKRLLEEEEALKKQEEEAAKDLLKLIELETLRRELQKLVHPELRFSNNLHEEAKNEAIYQQDLETGDFLHPNIAIKNFVGKKEKEYNENKAFELQYNQILDLYKMAKSDNQTEAANTFNNTIYDFALKTNLVTDKDDFDLVWGGMNQDEKVLATLYALGHKYLSDLDYQQFKILDPQSLYDMLCAVTTANPHYKTLASKLKEVTKEKSKEVGEALSGRGELFGLGYGLGNAWREATEHATNRFLLGLLDWSTVNPFATAGAGLVAATGHLGNFVGRVGDQAMSWAYYETHGGSEAEEIDASIRISSDNFIRKVSQSGYESFIANATEELKQTVIDTMKNLSRDESFGSNYYRLHEGDNYTKNVTDNDLIREFFNLNARSSLFGEYNASQYLKNYWQDVVASNQSIGDKTLATGALLLDTFVADMASLTAVVTNPLFMPIDTHGSANPEDWTVDGEGYSDALVKRNVLLKWAAGLQETGCYSMSEQEKYKKLGLSKDLLYRTVDLENLFMSANDIGDIIGLYGFTAATTLMSMGGSAAVKAMATSVAKNAVSKGIKGSMARSLLKPAFMKGEAKLILKNALKAGASELEITRAMQIAAEMGSKTLYRGNLMITSLLGTAEGALEAIGTFNNFIDNNLPRVEADYVKRVAKVKLASRELLRDYMINAGYPEGFLSRIGDGGAYHFDFTEEQYELAREELLAKCYEAYLAASDRVDDDALDAAAANLLANSMINGALNILGKELSMSKDARNSIRTFKGDRKFADMVNVERSAVDGKWHATVNRAIEANKNHSWWGDAKNALKLNGKWNKAKALYNATKESTLGKIIENAGSEGLEEFLQGVSDLASRAAFENDLNQYLLTVYDKEARELFVTDWGGIVNAGLNEITTNSINADNIKAAMFGFFSTTVGGVSPGSFISKAHGFGQEQKEAKGVWGKAKAYTKWALSNVGGLYDGAIRLALADNDTDYASAKRLQESTELWLQNGKNLELLTHMGGAIGFNNLLQLSLIAGDDFMAKNHHLGMAIENALMMKALKGTAMYEEYLKALEHRLSLSQIVDSEDKSQIFFDENGKLRAENLTAATSDNEDTLTQSIRDTAQNLQSLISQFKNTNSLNFTSGMTDLEIIKKISKNAGEMLELNNRVERASLTLAKVFHQQEIDPLVQSAYVYAMISLEDARARRNTLTLELLNAVEVTDDGIFTDEEVEALLGNRAQSLNQTGIDLTVAYGSIEKAVKLYRQLQKKRNLLEEDAHSKKNKSDRKEAKRQQKVVEAQLNTLGAKLRMANIQVALEESTPTQQETTEMEAPIEGAEGGTIILSDTEVQQEETYPLMSVQDLVNMSPRQRFEVLSNRDKFSLEQNAIIDLFINITRKGLAALRNDPSLQNEEVIADYKDLYKLAEKSKAYDNFLLDYINNPHFLNDRAGELQALDRTRTLRYLYREDLLLKEDETPLDMLDRVQEKIEELKKEEKYFDAEILQRLVSENEEVAKLKLTVANLTQLQIAIAVTSPLEARKPEFSKAILALQALAANSNKSLDEIKKMLDNSDVEGITEILKGLLKNGEYTLNRYFKLAGILEVNMDTENFDSLILTIKNYVDMYYLIKALSEELHKPVQVQGTASPTVYQDPVSLLPPPPPTNLGGPTNTDNSESSTLKILSPGEISDNTPQGLALLEFLKQHHVNVAVHNLQNKLNLLIRFMVTKDYSEDTPQVFAVIELDKSITPIKGVHYTINGKHYLIIGVINPNQLGSKSKKLAALASSTFASLSGQSTSALLGDTEDLYSDFNKLDMPKSVGNLSQLEPKPLKDLLQSVESKIRSWIDDFIRGGKRRITTDSSTGDEIKNYSFVDLYGYPVTIGEKGNPALLYDFPIGGTPLEKLLSSNRPKEEIIAELKKNSFFKTFFKVWTDTPSTTLLKPSLLFSRFIGDFVYLGNNNNLKDGELSSRENDLNARVEDRKLIIDSYNHEATISFSLPMSRNNDKDKELDALEALLQIVENSKGESDRNFTYSNIQLNWNIIENSHKSYDLEIVENEKARIYGLIDAGLLIGYAPSAISRNMTIRNPFTNSTKTSRPVGGTNNGAPRMDAPNSGTLPGGTVDPATGQVLRGNPETAKSLIEKSLTKAVERAEEIVNSLIARSKLVVLEGKEGYRNESTDTNYGRVTSAELAFIGASTTPWQGEQGDTISTAFGNIIDNTFRAALDILNSSTGVMDIEELYNKILLDKAFKGKTSIPCHSKRLIKSVLKELIAFKQLCDLKGWHLVPKDIRAFGYAPVVLGGAVVGTIPVAGTLDILVYDNEGVFHIIDMKTKRIDDDTESKFDDSIEGWTALVNTYQALLQMMYPDMRFGTNYVMPIGVNYNLLYDKEIVAEDGMTVEGLQATAAPKMKPSLLRSSLATTVEDYLVEIESREFLGYDYARLSVKDLGRLIHTEVPVGNPLNVTESPTTTTPATPNDGPTPPPAPTDSGGSTGEGLTFNDDDFGDGSDFLSTRTKRQSRFTDFVNNHVANLVRPKLNIVSRIKTKFKELMTHTGYVDKIVKLDLANTFFNGDVEKFERICGKDISIKALPLIIASLRKYFSTYSEYREWYVQNVSNRHLAASLIYKLLNKLITVLELELELSKMNIEAQNIPELVEYFSAENKEEAAKLILDKLEKSKLHTTEDFLKRLTELTNFMDSIDAKLDFLNSGMAFNMLSTRVTSIRESALNDNVEELQYKDSESLDDLLAGKEGNYGALKLLKGIAGKSKNRLFRRLAAKLFKEIKTKKITINVTLDNGQITDIEGEANGSNITIHKTSLDNYEHLERVLLHEMLHSVVKATPEIRELLLEYLDTTISLLMKNTNRTKEDIIALHYGLTNVDEFISEYFTNIAFQESLKGVSDNTENFNSIYDKITHSIKSFLTGNRSIYDEVTPIMEHLIGTHNSESTKKSMVESNTSLVKTQFSLLEGFLLLIITKKGFTAKEFEDLPSILLEVLMKCCL